MHQLEKQKNVANKGFNTQHNLTRYHTFFNIKNTVQLAEISQSSGCSWLTHSGIIDGGYGGEPTPWQAECKTWPTFS